MPRDARPVHLAAWLVAAWLAALPTRSTAEAPVHTQWGAAREPSWPTQVCATLSADIISKRGSIDDYDADGVNTHPDHDRLQKAIDACPVGAVKLVAGDKGEDGFLISPIRLKSNVTLWIDKGVTVFASRDPKDYDTGSGDCGTNNHNGHPACHALFEGKNLERYGIVGDGKVDGRGGSRLLSGPNKGRASWWDIEWQGRQGLGAQVFPLVQTEGGRDFLIYRVTFENGPGVHLAPSGDGVIAWEIKILAPSLVYSVPGYACPTGSTPDVNPAATCFTPATVKATDGFAPANAMHVLLAYSWISDGGDAIAIEAGGKLLSADQTYAHNHVYSGNGLALGPETDGGAEHLLIDDLVMDGKGSRDGSGLRLTSNATSGGKIRDVVFQHICMTGEAHPIVFDADAGAKDGAKNDDRTGKLHPDFRGPDFRGPDFKGPDFKGIVVRDLHYVPGSKSGAGVSTFRGFEESGAKLPVEVTLDTVVWDSGVPGISTGHAKADGTAFAAHLTLVGKTSFAKVFTPSDADDVTVKTEPSSATTLSACDGAFVPLSSVLPDSPI